MAYSCYVRAEGRDLVTVQPAVTIQFDQIHAITRNRLRRVLQDNYCPTGWSSKTNAIVTSLEGHYEIFKDLFAPELMGHAGFDRETFEAKALLLGFTFNVHADPRYYRGGYGYVLYKGDKPYDQRGPQMKQMKQLKLDTLLPIAKSLIDHDRLAPIMEALEKHQPYTFTARCRR